MLKFIKKLLGKEEKKKSPVGKIFAVVGIAFLVISLVIIVIAPQPYYTTGFATLDELKKYSDTLNEEIKMEGVNPVSPSYENYYTQNFSLTFGRKLYGKFKWVLSLVGISQSPLFSSSYFKTLLTKTTKQRIEKNLKGEFIQKAALNKDSKVIVFGVTQGAFHSVIRCLYKLKDLGIIDDKFKLTSKEYYIVFMSNVVNRSPFNLEQLTLVLKLIEQNPDNIVYLRGTNEFFKSWGKGTLANELGHRASHLSLSNIPLQDEVDAFFNTLPMTVFFTIPASNNGQTSYFKIRAFIKEKNLLQALDDATYADFIKKSQEGGLSVFNLNDRAQAPQESAEELSLQAIITDIRKRDSYEAMDGLRLLSPINDVTAWTILSTPAEPYRILLKFFYDAFAIISPADELKDWKITLYNRDVRNKSDQSFMSRWQYFFSGETEKYRLESEKKKVQESVDKPTVQPALQPVSQSADKPIVQPADQPTTQFVTQAVDKPIVQPPAHPVIQPEVIKK